MPSSQNNTPRPKPISTSMRLRRRVKQAVDKKVPDLERSAISKLVKGKAIGGICPVMILIGQVKQWDAHALLTGERPVWWKRLLIRIFVGTVFSKEKQPSVIPQ